MQVLTADHDSTGSTRDVAFPHYGATEAAAQGWMILRAADLIASGLYAVAQLEARYLRLERHDGSGGTTFTITD